MSLFLSKAPYHVIIYSLIFGASTFQSFLAAPVALSVLERRQFGVLQNKIFPGYFIAQSVAPVLLFLTAPYQLGAVALSTLSVCSVSGLANYFYFLPWTEGVRYKRYALEDANKHKKDNGEFTDTMKALNSEFSKSHGLSLVFNMSSILSLLGYGFAMTRGLVRYVPK
ncbi:hypothetical protein BABINDRAFT_169201 [Babjeviella inositovora NRRL Y-12698]|uniref:TMEM205-like domain-containing protein n=1 Tax=Babjeviella inositovora NRRL Y-12698 TaxID=984486 RepID=A0A1E3QI06_9ASCO|nr:uncharacterized protein BABINDRAFT_169201 [Babjeviella inositovora NRRL Y-12698]ODQ77326.1 hypothetical protein BABINDRAFT_169201 [Babjeviella inositovora NRRL Y-12698]